MMFLHIIFSYSFKTRRIHVEAERFSDGPHTKIIIFRGSGESPIRVFYAWAVLLLGYMRRFDVVNSF